MTAKAWTAFWFFKREHDVGKTPDGIRNLRALERLFALCPIVNGQTPRKPTRIRVDAGVTGSLAPSDATVRRRRNGAAQTAGIGVAKGTTRIDCLPDRLHKLVVDTYGPRPSLAHCRNHCIPIPADLAKREIVDYERHRGVQWCRSCLQLSTNLPLHDILAIERKSALRICSRPQIRLPRWSSLQQTARGNFAKVGSLFRAFPGASDHARDFAVIIGNRNYRNGIETHPTAHGNAAAFYAFVTEYLGFSSDRVIDLRDATLDELQRVFGTRSKPDGTLRQRLAGRPTSRVLVYFAGHGFTGSDLGTSYLLPVGAVRHREGRTGYALADLYAGLARLDAKSTLVLLEAGFGRDLGRYIYPPNLPEFPAVNLPRQPKPRLTVLTATEGDQKPLEDAEYRIGLFTRYAIEGLTGKADKKPLGNGDRQVDAVELYAFVAHMVDLAARKSFGLLQKPLLSHHGNLAISRIRANSD